MTERLRLIVLIAELAILSVQDFRRNRISVYLLLSMILLAAVFRAAEVYFIGEYIDEGYTWCILGGVLFGAAISVVGYFSGMLGLGDGIVVILICIMTDGFIAVGCFMAAMVIASVTSAILLICGRVKRKYQIPFVPFLFFSVIGVMLCM